MDNATAVQEADVLAIAVKPQDAGALLEEFGAKVPADKLVISLCAGLPTAFFARRLPEGTPVIRVMTNTPALVDEAMTAISAGAHATAGHLATGRGALPPARAHDPGCPSPSRTRSPRCPAPARRTSTSWSRP